MKFSTMKSRFGLLPVDFHARVGVTENLINCGDRSPLNPVGENRIRPGQGGAGAGAGESHLGFLFPRHSISYHIPIYFTLQFHGNWLDQILARAKKASGFTSGFGI
ncbi:hypothetical protein V6N12_071661 [Hibiscus sabdariffa]|uniref:Uncharacterized protein n=1 Tax=Hibiscus sabdariffa TaxID=183260 RepID=A0ABR2FL23_9ROSI